MDIDTVLAIVGLVAATNSPFYLLTLQNYRLIAWIKTHCPQCIKSMRRDEEVPDL